MESRSSAGLVERQRVRRLGARGWAASLLTMTLMAMTSGMARASGPAEMMLEATAILELEHKAASAEPREQCYLYTEVMHSLTELAGRQIAHGEDEAAGVTLLQVDAIAQRIRQTTDGNAKRLKGAEQLMEHTQHRLNDMLRVASADERLAMQSTMQRVNSLHEHMLALVFSR